MSMKQENLMNLQFTMSNDLETIRRKSDFLGVRFEKLMNDNIAQNLDQVELNKPMSSKLHSSLIQMEVISQNFF